MSRAELILTNPMREFHGQFEIGHAVSQRINREWMQPIPTSIQAAFERLVYYSQVDYVTRGIFASNMAACLQVALRSLKSATLCLLAATNQLGPSGSRASCQDYQSSWQELLTLGRHNAAPWLFSGRG